MNQILKVLSKFSDVVMPRQCFGCGVLGTYLCGHCLYRNYISHVHGCHVCGKQTGKDLVHGDCREMTYLDGLVHVTVFDGVVRELIKAAKYSDAYLVLDDLGKVMAQFGEQHGFLKESVITSVPLHRQKQRKRGYNQAEVLAKYFCKYSGRNYTRLLKRNRNTKTQVGMNETSRQVNLKSAFEVLSDNDLGRTDSVVIIDDVFTTGSTLNECAKVLKEQYGCRVFGYAFAKARVYG